MPTLLIASLQTDPASFLELLKTGGGAALLLWFVFDKVWPWISDKVYPDRMTDKRAARERSEKLEERQIAAFEKVAQAVEQSSTAFILTAERLDRIDEGQGEILKSISEQNRVLTAAIARMEERTRPRSESNP